MFLLQIKTYLVTTYMILLGITGIVTASLIAAFMAIIGYNAFFMALLVRIRKYKLILMTLVIF